MYFCQTSSPGKTYLSLPIPADGTQTGIYFVVRINSANTDSSVPLPASI